MIFWCLWLNPCYNGDMIFCCLWSNSLVQWFHKNALTLWLNPWCNGRCSGFFESYKHYCWFNIRTNCWLWTLWFSSGYLIFHLVKIFWLWMLWISMSMWIIHLIFGVQSFGLWCEWFELPRRRRLYMSKWMNAWFQFIPPTSSPFTLIECVLSSISPIVQIEPHGSQTLLWFDSARGHCLG